MSTGEIVKLAHVLTQPVRYRITNLLKSKGRAYIKEIADDLNVDRKVVAFHLRVMEREGLLETSLETKVPQTGNPVLVRYAKLTDKARRVLEKCGF